MKNIIEQLTGKIAIYHEHTCIELDQNSRKEARVFRLALREVFNDAVLKNASYVIVAHNHPSGRPHAIRGGRYYDKKVGRGW